MLRISLANNAIRLIAVILLSFLSSVTAPIFTAISTTSFLFFLKV
jgi:hypothetical protein